jgi:hypothetical protein
MKKMAECRNKKRMQIYLDGWMNEIQSARFEEHLRRCDDCQSELVSLEEMSSAALEIVDHAPEREYWENFAARVKNRILARQASPYAERKSAGFRLKIASYSVSLIAVAAVLLLTFGLLSEKPDIMVADDGLSGPDVSRAAEITDNEQSGAVDAIERDATTDFSEMLSGPDLMPGSIEKSADTKSAFADDSSLPADDEGKLPDSEAASILSRDFAAAFRSPLKVNPATVSFSEYENFLSRLLTAYGGYSGSDFSVNPNVVTEGILTGYAIRTILDRDAGGSAYINGFVGPENRVSPGWGYLGLPGDMASEDEFRRYLIELELMQLK